MRKALTTVTLVTASLGAIGIAHAAYTLEEVDRVQAEITDRADRVTMVTDPAPGAAETSEDAQANREARPGRWQEMSDSMNELLLARYIEKHYVQLDYPDEHGDQYGPYLGATMWQLLKAMRAEGFLAQGGLDTHRDELRWRIGGYNYVNRYLRGGDPIHKGNRIYKNGADFGNRWRLLASPPTVQQWLDSYEAA